MLSILTVSLSLCLKAIFAVGGLRPTGSQMNTSQGALKYFDLLEKTSSQNSLDERESLQDPERSTPYLESSSFEPSLDFQVAQESAASSGQRITIPSQLASEEKSYYSPYHDFGGFPISTYNPVDHFLYGFPREPPRPLSSDTGKERTQRDFLIDYCVPEVYSQALIDWERSRAKYNWSNQKDLLPGQSASANHEIAPKVTKGQEEPSFGRHKKRPFREAFAESLKHPLRNSNPQKPRLTLKNYTVEPSQLQLMRIATMPPILKVKERREAQISACFQELAKLESWKAVIEHSGSAQSQRASLMCNFLLRLWNMNARILFRFGISRDWVFFYDIQFKTMMWYLRIVTKQLQAYWTALPKVIEDLYKSEAEEKWLLSTAVRGDKKISKRDLLETKIVIHILGSYYKSQSPSKWGFFFSQDENQFIFMLEQITSRLLSNNKPLRSKFSNQGAPLFPWDNEPPLEIGQLVYLIDIPRSPMPENAHAIKAISEGEI
ncbi:hypothetical protein O181_027022 [Austropuccinia psidii MF-1]|uniref:Uncharacterized protein n=1 Tax=Austropuccinia psidii MF-1 TaxID=1389203 RepID=A0A9Q3CRS1_9BASI|nr:hypothetical protein [Austropuccinia psidii MF-1]